MTFTSSLHMVFQVHLKGAVLSLKKPQSPCIVLNEAYSTERAKLLGNLVGKLCSCRGLGLFDHVILKVPRLNLRAGNDRTVLQFFELFKAQPKMDPCPPCFWLRVCMFKQENAQFSSYYYYVYFWLVSAIAFGRTQNKSTELSD